MTLEELESRCDDLQRRVAERTPGHASRSPPRPHSRYNATSASSARPQSPNRSHYDAAPTMSPRPADTSVNNSSATVSGQGMSFSDTAFAVNSLEREKSRLEEQLRLVNLHLAAYRQLQDRGGAPPAATRDAGQTASSVLWQQHQAASNASRHVTPRATTGTTSAPVASTSSPTRRRSPPRQRSPPRASVQTEQIYEELRQIRRAREEREAQRRAAMSAASPNRM
jgi:hypothetical protein